jgi:alpha-tubulin suppressor-like RCC1 family protein
MRVSLSEVTAIAAGSSHTLALRADGTVWAWGGPNWSGELGNGTLNSSSKPVQVGGLSGVTAIAAGAFTSLALRTDGTVWAWGEKPLSEIGNAVTAHPTPEPVSGLSGVTAIAAGGFNLALRSDGTVWTWGYSSRSPLEDGTARNSLTPVRVSGLSGVTAIAGGGGQGLAIRADGTVWTWGYNTRGQLGNGTTTNSFAPGRVRGLSGVTAVAGGHLYSLALRTDGTVWAWGYNASGQLGDGTLNNSSTPIQVNGLSGVTAIAAGPGYHSLALRNDGTVRAWGENAVGQLGNGTTNNSPTPVQVSSLSRVTAIASGGYQSLALHA